MESELTYSLIEGGKEIENGKGKAIVKKEEIKIKPQRNPFSISLEEISEVSDEDYKINIKLVSGKELTLSKLGHEFDLFLKRVRKNWNEVVLERLLMDESLKHSGPSADLVYKNDKTGEKIETEAEIHLYETGLVLLMKEYVPKRIPYGDIKKIDEEDFGLSIRTGVGEKFTLSKMGHEFDSFKEEFFGVLNDLEGEVQEIIEGLAPSLSSLDLRKASGLLKDGKAVKKSDLEDVSPALWNGLVEGLGDFEDDLNFLLSLSESDDAWVGLKKGLMGGLTEDYVWFLVPIYSVDQKSIGNVLAMEAYPLGKDSGMATYLFQIFNQEEYESFEDLNEMKSEIEDFIREVNRCMLDINFRREPIYLDEEKLEESQYSRYKFAIKHIPSLELLRDQFLGRVIHSKKWGKNLLKLLESKDLAGTEKVEK